MGGIRKNIFFIVFVSELDDLSSAVNVPVCKNNRLRIFKIYFTKTSHFARINFISLNAECQFVLYFLFPEVSIKIVTRPLHMLTGFKFIDAAIDAGNFTLALNLVNKRIKEQPNSSHNLACKCFVLANASLSANSKVTTDEALIECLALAKKTPSEPKTISLLTSAFKLLDYKPNEDLFESAIRKYQTPTLAYEWFKQTVNDNDLVGMQKATMSLSKCFKVDAENGRTMKLWAAATMVLVITCCTDKERLPNGKDKLLAMLGLKIIESVEAVGNKPLNAQEMYVKAHLLLRNGDFEKCLEELKSFLSKELDLELLMIYYQELEKHEMWEELYRMTTYYVCHIGTDDWDSWKLAIKSAKKLNKSSEIKEIIENYKPGRNSQLAKIYVVDDDDIEGKQRGFENYLSRFMNKLSLYLDLKKFLENGFIPKDKILDSLNTEYNKRDLASVVKGERKSNADDLNCLVNYIKIKSLIDPQIFLEKSFFKECCQYYEVTKHLLNNLEEYDYFAGFEFLILSIRSYLRITKSSENQTFLNLIIVLENAICKNKFEFHLQLWLAKFYLNTNIYSPLNRIYDSLKIKNVQIDTLSPYFMNHRATRCRKDDRINKLLDFYHHNVAMELPPMVMNCFEMGTYSKLKGFIEFKLRAENSIVHYELVVEAIQHARLTGDNLALDSITGEYVPILKHSYKTMILEGSDIDLQLHDNIDRKIMWNCGDHKADEHTKSLIDAPLSKLYDKKYVEIITLRELIIYDQHSRVWCDYKKRFLESLKNTETLSMFSEIEITCLNVLAWLLRGCEGSSPVFGEAPSNPLDASFNHYYMSIQDFDCVLTTLVKLSRPVSFFGEKKMRNKVVDVQKVVKSLMRKIDRTEILTCTKLSIKEAKDASIEWFANDEYGQSFNLPSYMIDQCYRSFETDVMKAIKEI